MATFHDIIGQEQIKEHLQNAISAKKISHAYIINLSLIHISEPTRLEC